MKTMLYYCPVYTEQWEDWTEVAYVEKDAVLSKKELVEKKINRLHQKILLRYGTSPALQRDRLSWFEREEKINLKSGRKGILFLHETCTLIPLKVREKEFEHDAVLGYFVYERIKQIVADEETGWGIIIFQNDEQYLTHQGYRSVREQYQLVKRWKKHFWQKIHVG